MSREIEGLKQMASEMFQVELAGEISEKLDNVEEMELFGFNKLSHDFYERIGIGEISGVPIVAWTNIDEFVLLQSGNRPFFYKTSDEFDSRKILPKQMMPTDGGTVPRVLRGVTKHFSSWGYAPAFLIHDWLFESRRSGASQDTVWTFEDAATVLAEVMKTMMERGYNDIHGNKQVFERTEDVVYLFYHAVSSSVARNMWDHAVA